MEKKTMEIDELIIVGSRYGVLSDVLRPLYEKGTPIEQEKINEVLGYDEFYLMPGPDDLDPYAIGAYTTEGKEMGFLWMYQAPALRQWIDENHARFVTIHIKRMNTKYGLMIAESERPIRLKPCDRISLDTDMEWADNLPKVMRSISIQSLALSVALLQDELEKAERWTERMQVRIDNLLRNLPSDLSAHHYRDAINLYKAMKSSKIEEVRQQCDIVLQAFVRRGSANQMQWWVKEWLPSFFQEVAKGDLVRLYETAGYTLERVENILNGAPANLFYLYKVNRLQFAYRLYYTALPRELYSRLLTLLAVYVAMQEKKRKQEESNRQKAYALTESRKDIVRKLDVLIDKGCWVSFVQPEVVKAFMRQVLGIGTQQLTPDQEQMSKKLWTLFEKRKGGDAIRVTWQNMIGYFDSKGLFDSRGGSPNLNKVFFDTKDNYSNIDKGRLDSKDMLSNFKDIIPLLEQFCPQKT